uniref:Glyco_18 domain-containing protein n=1 Tax=Caenorhabditis tropicalis TaxID=1561998 RepID=A0A1I7SZV7_9PELO
MITKATIVRENEQLNDDFYHPGDKEGYVQLAYITPWNNRGYDLAKKTAHKLSHISPVWFQAKAAYENSKLHSCNVEGSHDIDRNWLETLREKNEKIKIVPRILFDGWSADDMKELLMSTKIAKRCFEDIANFYSRNQFEGAVVEIFMQALIAVQSLEIKEFVIESIGDLSKAMKKLHMEIILTVPAPLEWSNQPNNLVTPDEFKKISEVSDYVQIMTYDYHGNKPAGVAPYDWFENCIFFLGAGPKTLAGLNFYGYEFGNGKVEPITADRYLKLLKEKNTKLDFDMKSMEHRLVMPKVVVYFPSLTSLELRINMAHRYEIGIAIWDYGQGFDYFTNLLI